MHRFCSWEIDPESGARSISFLGEWDNIRKLWKLAHKEARMRSPGSWEVQYCPPGIAGGKVNNFPVLTVRQQMRIKYHEREAERLEVEIRRLRSEQNAHLSAIIQNGGV